MHVAERELTLYATGEADPAVAGHVAGCAECRAELERLRAVLAALGPLAVPEPDAAFGRRTWQRLEARIDAHRPRVGAGGRRLPRAVALAAGLSLVALAAFVAGRYSAPDAEPLTAEMRERALGLAVADHLESSWRLLVDVVNAAPGPAPALDARRDAAAGLVARNRLYRRAAERAGREEITLLLDELERVLLEVANAPAEAAPGAELARVRQRILGGGMLLKLRVVGERTREETRRPAGRATDRT